VGGAYCECFKREGQMVPPDESSGLRMQFAPRRAELQTLQEVEAALGNRTPSSALPWIDPTPPTSSRDFRFGDDSDPVLTARTSEKDEPAARPPSPPPPPPPPPLETSTMAPPLLVPEEEDLLEDEILPVPQQTSPTAYLSPESRRMRAWGSPHIRSNRLQRKRLQGITEQRVLKRGIEELHRCLAGDMDDEELTKFKRRENGSKLLMQESFFSRLLADGIMLKQKQPTDVAAAQSDVKHLNLVQLLTVRKHTLDFQTESTSHNAHNNFLETVDRHLFSGIAKHKISSGIGSDSFCKVKSLTEVASLTSGRDVKYHSLGLRLTLIVGALIELGNNGESLPPCWVVELNPEEWSGGRLALFHATELWVRIFRDHEQQALSDAAGGKVNVIWDGSHGKGAARMVYWEISTVSLGECDLLTELIGPESKTDVSGELKEALLRRSTKPLD